MKTDILLLNIRNTSTYEFHPCTETCEYTYYLLQTCAEAPLLPAQHEVRRKRTGEETAQATFRLDEEEDGGA